MNKTMKVISIICAVSVIALGLTDVVFTCAGLMFPRPLNYILWPLCAINAVFLMMYAKKKI